MAKNDEKPTSGGTAKVKFRFVEFEMEGGNERIEQGLKAFAQTVMRGPEPLPPRAVSNPRVTAPQILEAGRAERAAEDEAIVETDDAADSGEGVQQEASSQRSKKRSAPRAPKFLSNLDLTAGTSQLKDFVAVRDPKDTQERYIVICQWFKEHLSTDEISVDHIFSAYKHLGWVSQLPPDPNQPLRDLRYKKTWLDAGATKGTYKVNWSGTNHVNKMGSSGAE